MKRTPTIVLISLLVCLFVSSLVLAGCEHRHDYEDQWYSNATHHWRKCAICEVKNNKSEHTVAEGGWLVVNEPTEAQMGLRRGRCTVCKRVVEEDIPRLEHEHRFVGDYVSDSLGHWKECTCGEKGEFAVHEVTNWIVDVEATETTQGQQHGECNVCRSRVDGTIPVVGHTHKYAGSLSYDDTYHYYECVCGDQIEVSLHDYSADWNTDDLKHWLVCECGRVDYEQSHITTWIIDTPATTASAGSKHEECTVCGITLRTETIDRLTSTTREVDFYAINDFHGEVDKIAAIGGYLNGCKNNNANTVLINSGDMFQGSMESNSNYGRLLTDCMDVIGFDAFAFGNHEFDWGLGKLEGLANNSNVPFLGANIYHWNASSKTWGTFASELAQKYVVKTLDNGLKIGIIGVIGENQITSISSNLVQTIGFKDPLPIIQELATELREDENCDVVVVTAHASPRGLVGESEGNYDPEEPSSAHGLEKYVDAVFCAHTHREQNFNVDGLMFIQGGSYGSNVSHITLTVNATGNVTCADSENITYSNSWKKLADITELVNSSNEKIKDERNQVLANLSGVYLNKNPAIPRLVSRAVVEYAYSQGHTDVVLAMVNTARSSLSAGDITYSKLYEAIPFDNEVYIARVKGSEILNEVNYGVYFWRASGVAIESDQYYKIAIIDYLLFHQNASRNYNYFRSAFTSGFEPVALTHNDYDVYNYRLITRDYLLANGINAYDYIYDNNNTNTDLLEQNVTLDYQTTGSWTSSRSAVPERRITMFCYKKIKYASVLS